MQKPHPFPPPSYVADNGPHSPEEISLNEKEQEKEGESFGCHSCQVFSNAWAFPSKVVGLVGDIWNKKEPRKEKEKGWFQERVTIWWLKSPPNLYWRVKGMAQLGRKSYGVEMDGVPGFWRRNIYGLCLLYEG